MYTLEYVIPSEQRYTDLLLISSFLSGGCRTGRPRRATKMNFGGMGASPDQMNKAQQGLALAQQLQAARGGSGGGQASPQQMQQAMAMAGMAGGGGGGGGMGAMGGIMGGMGAMKMGGGMPQVCYDFDV